MLLLYKKQAQHGPQAVLLKKISLSGSTALRKETAQLIFEVVWRKRRTKKDVKLSCFKNGQQNKKHHKKTVD